MTASVALIYDLERQISDINRRLKAGHADHPYVSLLMSVSGIGWVLAFTIAAEIGESSASLHQRSSPATPAFARAFGERTGRIVTAAALLFCVAIGAFATSGILFIKLVGVGTALAVAIDATIIRALLVPALMALLGRWNWWAPATLRRLHARIGIGESGA